MRHPPRERLEAYARGEADVAARLLVEAHLALCGACGALTRQDRGAEAGPDASAPPAEGVPPFENVWPAIERADAGRRSGAPAALPPSLLAALPVPSAWRWIVLSRSGVRTALLVRDADTGSTLYLSQYPPRSRFPAHRHLGLEETVVLAGGYADGATHVEAGDWIAAARGTEHAPATAPDEDCWCLSRVEAPGIRFRGWRGWLQRLLTSRS